MGDIILYVKDSQFVCHRLVKKIRSKDNYLLYVRGDNSNSIEIVDENMFRGKIISILRKNRFKNLTTGFQLLTKQLIVIFSPFIRSSLNIAKFFLRGGK